MFQKYCLKKYFNMLIYIPNYITNITLQIQSKYNHKIYT